MQNITFKTSTVKVWTLYLTFPSTFIFINYTGDVDGVQILSSGLILGI